MHTLFRSLTSLEDQIPAGSSSTESQAVRAMETSQQAAADIERLMMICEALWNILQERYGYADEELFRRITEIDLRDGRADGRVAPGPPERCAACGHVVSKQRPICLYCGRPMVKKPFAR